MNTDIIIIVCLHSKLICGLIKSQEGRVKRRICCKLNDSRATVRKSILVAKRLTDSISNFLYQLSNRPLPYRALHIINNERIHGACETRINHFNLKDILILNVQHCALCVVCRLLKFRP